MAQRRDYEKRDDQARRFHGSRENWGFGKCDEDMPAGILPAPEDGYDDDVRVVSIWKGPAHSPDADTGADVVAHYSKYELAAGTYVTWSRKADGKVYVMPWDCPEEGY